MSEFEFDETPSRETVRGDIEGFEYACDGTVSVEPLSGCGYHGHLVPVDWDTPDWARVVCPRCFVAAWIRVYD